MPRRAKPFFSRPFAIDLLWRRSLWAVEYSFRQVGARISAVPFVAQRIGFFHAWRANPKSIGAITPSSARLARAMTRHISSKTGPVIELGCGTGVFTRALVARGVNPADLALIEMDPRFAHQLAHDFPQAQVHAMDASRLATQELFDGELAGAAICGLPLLNLPLKVRIGIVRGTFAHLRPGGALYFFTYGLHCPIPRRVRDHLRLRAAKIDLVLANVPPAHVWRVTRRGSRD